jgi:hypothetical protein
MELEELSHLPLAKTRFSHDKTNLSLIPFELANVEFEGSGLFRPIYIRGIMITEEYSDIPYLVWSDKIKVTSGEADRTIKTILKNVTSYQTQVRINSFSKK